MSGAHGQWRTNLGHGLVESGIIGHIKSNRLGVLNARAESLGALQGTTGYLFNTHCQ